MMTQNDMRESLMAFKWTDVYIIFDVDALGDTESAVEQMNPAGHVLAGWGEGYRPDDRVHAAAASQMFTETEDDSNYEYGYLARECGNQGYRGVADEDEMRCDRCGAELVYVRDSDSHVTWDDERSDACVIPFIGEDGEAWPVHAYQGRGRHRKWVGTLTRDQWRQFAGAYCIELGDDELPETFEQTLGSITEHGFLEAISVDVREGWSDYTTNEVITAGMYLSFYKRGKE